MSIFLSSLLCLTEKQAFENQAKKHSLLPYCFTKDLMNTKKSSKTIVAQDISWDFIKNIYIYNFMYDDNTSGLSENP